MSRFVDLFGKKNIGCVFARTAAITVCILTICLIATGCGDSGTHSEDTHIESTIIVEDVVSTAETTEPLANISWDLSVPTQITKIGDKYFIVDCYHNRVIYNENISDPIGQWKVMTDSINMGHTVAGDGEVYLVDDTENNRVLVFEYADDKFINTQVFDDIGVRPHYIVYNEEDDSFYAWSSMTGQMYVFKHDSGSRHMYISRIMTIDKLDGIYVRSFTITGNSILLVSGNSSVIEADIDTFKIKKVYEVRPELAGMIQIMPVESGYYLTISTDVNGNQDFATLIYAEDLSDLAKGKYTDIYSYFIGGGTPYYMGKIDNRYYLTEHRLPGHAIWSFDIGADGIPMNVEEVY